MKSADANHETNIGTDQDVDVKELIGDMLTSGDGTSSMLYTKALITSKGTHLRFNGIYE